MPGAQGIVTLRNSNALVNITGQGAGPGHEAEQPAVGQMVVKRNRIAAVIGLAASAEALKQGGFIGRAKEQIARLTENGKRDIDELHVIVGADIAVGVRRQQAVHITHALEAAQWPWQMAAIGRSRLQDRVNGGIPVLGAGLTLGQRKPGLFG